MGPKYGINAVNNSSQEGSICVYQTATEANPNVMSLAWLVRSVPPQGTVGFEWTHDYAFVQEQTGPIVPGMVFNASQMVPASLSGSNSQITLTHSNGLLTFADQTAGPSPGSLFIRTDATVPVNQAAAGIAMSGAGMFIAQAQPNTSLVFTTHSQYWIAFGNFVPQQVLDVDAIAQNAEVTIPIGVASVTATFDDNGTWTWGNNNRRPPAGRPGRQR